MIEKQTNKPNKNIEFTCTNPSKCTSRESHVEDMLRSSKLHDNLPDTHTPKIFAITKSTCRECFSKDKTYEKGERIFNPGAEGGGYSEILVMGWCNGIHVRGL